MDESSQERHASASVSSDSSSIATTSSFQSIPEQVVPIHDANDIVLPSARSSFSSNDENRAAGHSVSSFTSDDPQKTTKRGKKHSRMGNRKISWVTGSSKEERLEVAINVLTMDQETEIAKSIRGFVSHFQGMCMEKRADASHGGADELVWKVREYLEGLNSYVITHKAEFPLLNSAINDMKQSGKFGTSALDGSGRSKAGSAFLSSGLGFESLATSSVDLGMGGSSTNAVDCAVHYGILRAK